MDKELLKELEKEFSGKALEEIIARIECGATVDNAIQSVVCVCGGFFSSTLKYRR